MVSEERRDLGPHTYRRRRSNRVVNGVAVLRPHDEDGLVPTRPEASQYAEGERGVGLRLRTGRQQDVLNVIQI